jgi:hypothetical protein
MVIFVRVSEVVVSFEFHVPSPAPAAYRESDDGLVVQAFCHGEYVTVPNGNIRH